MGDGLGADATDYLVRRTRRLTPYAARWSPKTRHAHTARWARMAILPVS
jgi:hypothetical protein